MAIVVPEAQLQAYVLGLAREAFPHENADSFTVETRLKVRFGRSEHDHNGSAFWEAEGRADLLIFHKGRPLAVVELKREDKALSDKDLKQGQSYAAVLNPRPPLVIVSNGNETWIRQAENGEPLDPGADGAKVIEKIFSNIGKLAASNSSWAIEVLMGPEANIWVEAVRRRTDELIKKMTGDPRDALMPFGEGCLFPRRATSQLASLLAVEKAVVIEGPPLSGKSNVLREFASAMRGSPRWAMLMVNGATPGPGLFQRLANVLGAALEWKLNADDVRTWLRRMSDSSRGPVLVLAVDGVKPGSAIANDIEELAETGFGDGLRVVACLDRAKDILRDSTGRSGTALSSIAKVIQVGPLDDDEFNFIQQELEKERIVFHGGAELSDEYRAPAFLRFVLASRPAPAREGNAHFLPACMPLTYIVNAKTRFNDLHDVTRLHRLLARDALVDDKIVSPELALAQAHAYVVRRDALSTAGEDAAVTLENQGWVSFSRDDRGEDLVSFRVPQLFMSELAHQLSAALENIIDENLEEAAALLIRQSGRFFLGDIIGASAIIELGKKRQGLPFSLTSRLVNDQPEIGSTAGTQFIMQMPDGTPTRFKVTEDGAIAGADDYGNEIELHSFVEEGEVLPAYVNLTSWMILSHLAWLPMTIGGSIEDRVDIQLFLTLGQCRMPLIRWGGQSSIRMHSIRSLGSSGHVLSIQHAFAEPLASGMQAMFMRDWKNLDFFFERLVAADALPLTVRVHNVLCSLRGATAEGVAAWVDEKLASVIKPLLRKQMFNSST